MSCQPLIEDFFEFPKRALNAAGQSRIACRIGCYTDFVESMVRAIDAAPELASWTHRQADDPGIALLEGAAVLGDILTFYQEHYANEAYLRTAAWRDSVAELVRLTGYRLAAGLGGRATLAFQVRGTAAVTIREAFPVKVELQGGTAPAVFQTDAPMLAWPHLGRFHLYAPRSYDVALPAGARSVELATIDGAGDSASLAAIDFKAGDRIMLVPDETVWSATGGSFAAQAVPQVVTVATVTRTLDRVVLALDKPVVGSWPLPLRAWRLGRTFRHFGHNAPPQLVRPSLDAAGTITGSTAIDTDFERTLRAGGAVTNAAPSTGSGTASSSSGSSSIGASQERSVGVGSVGAATIENNHSVLLVASSVDWYTNLATTEIPLDLEASDFAVGGTVIVQGRVRIDVQGTVPFVVTRHAVEARAAAMQWGNLGGTSTVLSLDGDLIQNATMTSAVLDIRDLRLHELKSPALTLRPLPAPASGGFMSGAAALAFYGDATQAQAIAGRRVHLAHADGRSVELVNTNIAGDFVAAPPDVSRIWPLSFDRPPTPFRLEDFGEALPTVDVLGNLVDATQGNSEREAVLGNGDQRRSFQTFVLPKAPLTYTLVPGAAPPQASELEIWVGGRLWNRVEALYGHGPDETIYVVREDAEGRSFVQFGDGEAGARLPSGLKNVSAVYRTGIGARGALKAGTSPTASERPPGFDKVTLAGIVSGGADPEDLDNARFAAPGKVQSLGRLVSLPDWESETLALPGVVAATAGWDLHVGVPVVMLRVLLEAGREAEFAALQSTLSLAQRCSGPDRYPLVIEQASMRYAFLDLNYARDASHAAEGVAAAVSNALGLTGDTASARSGVFGLKARQLGEPEYASRIEGRVQNLPGVLWCKVVALGLFAVGIVDPATAVLPPAPRPLAGTLGCAPNEMLQLAAPHLTVIEVATGATDALQECPP